MKRWGWLLVLPWMVQTDTATFGQGAETTYEYQYTAVHQLPGSSSVEVPCGNEQEACSDFVEAMNSAHRFREAAHQERGNDKDLYWKQVPTVPVVPSVPPTPQEQQ